MRTPKITLSEPESDNPNPSEGLIKATMNKNTGDGELDKYLNGLVRVKLDDKQKGHMLAKLSAKDKTAIKEWAAQEANKARLDEITKAVEVAKNHATDKDHSGTINTLATRRDDLAKVIQNKLEGLS